MPCGEHGAGYRNDDLIGRYRSLRGFDPQPFAAMIDASHRTIQHRGHSGAIVADKRAVAFEHAIIDAGVFVTVEILHRETIEIHAADIGADGVDQSIPTASGFEQS